MRLQSTKEFLAQYPDCIETREGRSSLEFGGGTFATEEIAKEFERWCQRKANSSQYVYLIAACKSHMHKIGIARHPFSRMKSMQVGSPLHLSMVRTVSVENPKEIEVQLHKIFKPYHSHGEWFEIEYEVATRLFDEVLYQPDLKDG